MKYAILIAETADGFAARTDAAQQDAYWAGVMHYLTALREAGILTGGAGLQPPASATTLHYLDGKLRVQDGPFADTKEQLGGFYVIEVADLDTALEWAQRAPAREGMKVEVRPLLPTD